MATEETLSLRGRIGAHAMHAKHDPRETTRAGTAAFLERFEREVDPDGTLDEPERQRRAAHARQAYFLRLSLKSAKARAARKTAAVLIDEAERSEADQREQTAAPARKAATP